MIESVPRRNELTLTGILALVLASVGCGGTEESASANEYPDDSSATLGASSSSNIVPSPEQSEQLIADGTVIVGSSAAPPSWNESPDGEVTTTLGEYVENVRSSSPIAHWFQETRHGAPERMYVTFYLRTADDRRVSFDFEYTGVQRTFSLRDSGAFNIVKNGEELFGRDGTVTIEPLGADALEVSFEQLVVGPENEAGGAEVIGNGVVQGPLRRLCNRAADVTYSHAVALKPTPPPLHDEAWIDQFCGTTN
jgi:hypothetical protein